MKEPESTDAHGPTEDADIASVSVAAKAIVAKLRPLASVKPKGPNAPRDLEGALKVLGDPLTVAAALSDTVDRARLVVSQYRATRSSEFRGAVAGFIREVGHERARETTAGWRVGRVELELDGDEATAKVLYNREQVSPASPVRTTHDIRSLYEQGVAALERAEIPDESLVRAVVTAYSALSTSRGPDPSDRIRLPDLLREVRVVMVREALVGRSRRAAEHAIAMPPWTLLLNIDRYRALSNQLPAHQRLAFETGSQKETASFGVLLNGLDATREYERYCFVRRYAGR